MNRQNPTHISVLTFSLHMDPKAFYYDNIGLRCFPGSPSTLKVQWER